MAYPYQKYNTNQTLETLDISFKVPPGSRSKDIEVKWDKTSITANVKHQPPTIKGEFYVAVNIKGSLWQLEGNTVTLHIEKTKEDLWPYIIKPGPSIDPCSQYRIGEAMLSGDLQGTKSQALALFQQAADRGMEDAQMKVGQIFAGAEEGYSVTTSESRAFTYFHMAANQHGNPDAILAVANAFHAGRGVEQNPKLAEEFYLRLVNIRHPHPDALYNLAVLYRAAPLAPDFAPDPQKAMQFFVKAAQLGSAAAYYALGTAYFGGDEAMIGEGDVHAALKCYEKAAELAPDDFPVPEQIREAVAEEEKLIAQEEEKTKKKGNETIGLAREVRESGWLGTVVAGVGLALVATFAFHWMTSRK